MNKGGFSFVAMLVINPIVILFYQNCSMTPVSHAKQDSAPKITATRSIASEEAKSAQNEVFLPACKEDKKNCLKAQ